LSGLITPKIRSMPGQDASTVSSAYGAPSRSIRTAARPFALDLDERRIAPQPSCDRREEPRHPPRARDGLARGAYRSAAIRVADDLRGEERVVQRTMPVVLGALTWGGLWLRYAGLRQWIPVMSNRP